MFDIESDISDVSDGDNLEDIELLAEIDETLAEGKEYEYIDAPEDPDQEDSSGLGEGEQDENKLNIAELDDNLPQDDDEGEDNGYEQKTSNYESNNNIQIREMQCARDSRMPDIPTLFEIGGLVISRACALYANNRPLVEYDYFDPAEIARRELIQGKSLRAVLRNDTIWRWTDFTCFPRGFMHEDESTASLHELR